MKSTPLPPLPDWLDRLLDQPWTPEASLMVDRWLAYLAAEFEGVEA